MSKRIFIALVPISIGIFFTLSMFAQSPEKMSCQAVIRDAGNNMVINQAVGMQISILQGSASGSAVYVETQIPTTNVNGLVSIEIGTGSTSDDFSAIDWANGPYFIKTETRQHGLVCALEDLDGGSGIQWYNGTSTNTEALGDGIYAGEMNTMLIITNQGASSNDYAAGICANYTVEQNGTTYGDWYLPSIHELNVLYLKRAVVGGFVPADYWSSTEVDNDEAWFRDFFSGFLSSHSKNIHHKVRAIRAF